MLGNGIGAMFGSRITQRMSMQKALVWSSVMAIMGSCLKIGFDLSLNHILIGRLMNGLAVGILYFLYGKAVNETIPNHLLPTYSLFSVTLLFTGYLASGWISFILPTDDLPKEQLLKDKSWKIVYGWTILTQIIGILFIFIFL